MTPSEAEVNAALLANKRRQAYFRRRREVTKLRGAPSALAVESMTTAHLWTHLAMRLGELEEQLAGGSSPRLYQLAAEAQRIEGELFVRVHQLQLDV